MKKAVAKLVQFTTGWKLNIREDLYIKKAVMIAAPHTSNWDLIHALAGLWIGGYRPKFFIKDSFKKIPVLNWVLKWVGAIWVDRKKNNNLINLSVELLNNSEELILLVPAEGTRGAVPKWKLGFYHIAKNANLPILLAYLDYPKKEAGIGHLVKITDSFENDMFEIENFYKNIIPRHPDKYNPKIFIRKDDKS